jgi:hypothetical protein
MTPRIIVTTIMGVAERLRFIDDSTDGIWIPLIMHTIDDYIGNSFLPCDPFATGLEEDSCC